MQIKVQLISFLLVAFVTVLGCGREEDKQKPSVKGNGDNAGLMNATNPGSPTTSGSPVILASPATAAPEQAPPPGGYPPIKDIR